MCFTLDVFGVDKEKVSRWYATGGGGSDNSGAVGGGLDGANIPEFDGKRGGAV